MKHSSEGTIPMLSRTAKQLLEKFVSRQISTKDFYYAFQDLMAELDASPEMTPEEQALSGIELLLYEAVEGMRDIQEVDSCAKDLLDAERAVLAKASSQ